MASSAPWRTAHHYLLLLDQGNPFCCSFPPEYGHTHTVLYLPSLALFYSPPPLLHFLLVSGVNMDCIMRLGEGNVLENVPDNILLVLG